MRISATHRTIYRYSEPVCLEPHVFRLRPRDDGTERVMAHSLSIDPVPAGRSNSIDAFGNSVVETWFWEPVKELSVLSAFEVETLRENPFDFLLPVPRLLELPLRVPEGLQKVLAPYRNGVGAGPVEAFSAELAGASGNQLMPFLESLNLTLFRTCRAVVRHEGPAHPAEETLARREGSCRDLAVLFCAAAKAAGVAARFVSGYEAASAFEHPAYMHAWAEVYIPGGGWRGYDPARGTAVGTSHVPVAAAVDPADAGPVSGTYRGRATSTMEFQLQMQVSSILR